MTIWVKTDVRLGVLLVHSIPCILACANQNFVSIRYWYMAHGFVHAGCLDVERLQSFYFQRSLSRVANCSRLLIVSFILYRWWKNRQILFVSSYFDCLVIQAFAFARARPCWSYKYFLLCLVFSLVWICARTLVNPLGLIGSNSAFVVCQHVCCSNLFYSTVLTFFRSCVWQTSLLLVTSAQHSKSVGVSALLPFSRGSSFAYHIWVAAIAAVSRFTALATELPFHAAAGSCSTTAVVASYP